MLFPSVESCLHRKLGLWLLYSFQVVSSGDAPPSQNAGSVVPVVGHLLFASGDAPPSQKAGSVVVVQLPGNFRR